jgi:dihydroorotate dehydrogenase (NAD+) catalytic subunit
MTSKTAGPDLSVDIAAGKSSLTLRNPVMVASGTFSYGVDYAKVFDIKRLGAIVSKTTTLRPRSGSPVIRIDETPAGMLNSIGLQNIGVERFLADVLPGLARFPARVIVNLFGYEFDDYARLAARVDPFPGIAAVELNVSCPNVEKGGMEFGHDPEILERLVASVRRATGKPIAVKLSPNAGSPVAVAEAARAGGADILSAINTVLGMSIDPWTRRPRLHTNRGGLSGPAIKPIALRIVFDVARKVGLPVIGIGGVETVDDVVEFLLAGASAVQVGTALFRDPRAAERLAGELPVRLSELGVERASDLVGAVRPWGEA